MRVGREWRFARRNVIAAYTRFELPFLWGSGKAAIADGMRLQRIRTCRMDPFLLEYISDPAMRQHIRAETTKIESYHQFTDWIAFGGPVLHSGDPVEQEKRIKYRDLVANAVMLHNVADMTNVLYELRPEGGN